MYRKTEDFLEDWDYESESTLKVFANITDAAMNKTIHHDVRRIGRLCWHITGSIAEIARHAGLKDIKGPEEDAPIPATMKVISEAYRISSQSLKEEVRKHWTDAYLGEPVNMYGEQWKVGAVLSMIIRHQAHHRGQLTVLMRSEGLKPVGVYGPAREEWAGMNLPAME